MKLLSSEVLVRAHRRDAKDHLVFRDRLEALVNMGEDFGLEVEEVCEFLRCVTSLALGEKASPLDQALAVVRALEKNRNQHWLSSGRQHWRLVMEIIEQYRLEGGEIERARLVALAIEHGATLVVASTEFERFKPSGLRLELWRSALI